MPGSPPGPSRISVAVPTTRRIRSWTSCSRTTRTVPRASCAGILVPGVVLAGEAARERLAWRGYLETPRASPSTRPSSPMRAAAPPSSSGPCSPRPQGVSRGSPASACTSGPWSTASSPSEVRHSARRCVLARRDRSGRREPEHPLLALRRLPLLHPRRGPAQHPAADPGRAGRQRAARLPARRHGPLQVGLQARPVRPVELIADCFALAAEIREMDMRASPYDLAELGYAPIAIETPAGRAEYAAVAGRLRPPRRPAAPPAGRRLRRPARLGSRGGGRLTARPPANPCAARQAQREQKHR